MIRNATPAGRTASPPPRPRPGAGTRLTANVLGYSYGAAAGRSQFLHPFRPSLEGLRLRLARGLVDALEPKIEALPMSQAALQLDAAARNERGESWAVLEVEPDAESGRLTAKARIEILHAPEPYLLEGDTGRCPLALLLWNGERPVQAHPCVHFNLRYYRLRMLDGADGTVRYRHLFL